MAILISQIAPLHMRELLQETVSSSKLGGDSGVILAEKWHRFFLSKLTLFENPDSILQVLLNMSISGR